jgi:hypothetical protein
LIREYRLLHGGGAWLLVSLEIVFAFFRDRDRIERRVALLFIDLLIANTLWVFNKRVVL